MVLIVTAVSKCDVDSYSWLGEIDLGKLCGVGGYSWLDEIDVSSWCGVVLIVTAGWVR